VLAVCVYVNQSNDCDDPADSAYQAKMNYSFLTYIISKLLKAFDCYLSRMNGHSWDKSHLAITSGTHVSKDSDGWFAIHRNRESPIEIST
jgi:hypothetical protein